MHLPFRPPTLSFLVVFGFAMMLAIASGGQEPAIAPGSDFPPTLRPSGSADEEQPAPTLVPTPEPPPPPLSLLANHRIVSYYGHPFTPIMGVIGEGPIEAVYERLKQQAAAYAALDSERPVKLAFHFVYGVAQEHPGGDGSYLYRTDDTVVRSYIDFARDHDMLIFLDLQNGRADVEAELQRILPYLTEPHVHVAIDPEFTMTPNKRPGVHIGSVTGAQVNRVQEILHGLVLEHHLPNKILIVHQFLDEMVWDKESITNFDRIDLVFDMDGFGWSGAKRAKYYRYAVPLPSEYRAIKLFYRWDTDLMSPASVLSLDPKPDIIIYQ